MQGKEGIYGPGFRLTKNKVVGDYLNAWAAHLNVHTSIEFNLSRGKAIPDKSFNRIFKIIETYEAYLHNHHSSVMAQVLADSDLAVISKINALVKDFNRKIENALVFKEEINKIREGYNAALGIGTADEIKALIQKFKTKLCGARVDYETFEKYYLAVEAIVNK